MAFLHVAILAIPMLRTATATAGPVEDSDTCETGDATSTQVAAALQIRQSAEGGFSCATVSTPKYDNICPQQMHPESCAEYGEHCQWGKCLALSPKDRTQCRPLSFADCAQKEGSCRWDVSVESCAAQPENTPKYADVCPEKISPEDCLRYSPHCRWGRCLALDSKYRWVCPPLNFAACEDTKDCRWGVESEEPDPIDCDHLIVAVHVKTDRWPHETSWSIRDSQGNISEEKTGPTDLDAQICVQEGVYEFTIKDTYGDGMCCSSGEGGFIIQLPNENITDTLEGGYSKTLTLHVQASGVVSPL
jgi:hypothetical protein